jgi:hypothetical protein
MAPSTRPCCSFEGDPLNTDALASSVIAMIQVALCRITHIVLCRIHAFYGKNVLVRSDGNSLHLVGATLPLLCVGLAWGVVSIAVSGSPRHQRLWLAEAYQSGTIPLTPHCLRSSLAGCRAVCDGATFLHCPSSPNNHILVSNIIVFSEPRHHSTCVHVQRG